MKYRYIIVFVFLCGMLYAQHSNLFVANEYKSAIKKGTRTETGEPGENYWINSSDYQIDATLNTDSLLLEGELFVRYYNNSPDTLTEVVFKLYPNVYKKGMARDFSIPAAAEDDGLTLHSLKEKGKEVDLTNRKKVGLISTALVLKLDAPIIPGGTANFELEWEYKPSVLTPIRTGAYPDSSFFMGYWYPQISVYDDIYGWDKLEYTGMTEEYNDFNTYQVSITVPENYIVWATGMPQNLSEVLSEETYAKYQKAINSTEITSIIDSTNNNAGIHTKKGNNTWKFVALNVPDFAFATGVDYLWDITTINFPDNPANERVVINSAYRKGSEDFYSVADIAKKAINAFSTHMPGIKYPWPSMTVFDGSGGMEFPMIVNDGSTKKYSSTVVLTSHEIAHTYFPFYMGTNERRFAWMDEGWARFLPADFQVEEGKDPVYAKYVDEYNKVAGKFQDMPLVTPSYNMKYWSYRTASYTRAHNAYTVLYDYMGAELFGKAIKKYINTWKEKHPSPYDFFNIFSSVANEDLSWFYKPWFFEWSSPDLGIKSVTEKEEGILVTVVQQGTLPVNIVLTVEDDEGSETEKVIKASCWKSNKENEIYFDNVKNWKSVKLGNSRIPDVNQEDNLFLKRE